MKRQIVFIAGCFRSKWGLAGRIINTIKAVIVARRLSKQGYTIFCPHLNALFIDSVGTDEVGRMKDLKVLAKCHVIYMLKGWRDSVGACEEFKEAWVRGLDVWYEDESDYPVWKELTPENFPLEATNAEQMAT
jgi:hypothetical protein